MEESKLGNSFQFNSFEHTDEHVDEHIMFTMWAQEMTVELM